MPDWATNAASQPLRAHAWPRFLEGPDPALLEQLYVPALQAALRYDRCCAYFSSSVLAAAARGFAGLIARLEALGDDAPRPAIRLVMNEELAAEDVKALTETGNLAFLEAALKRRFKSPQDALERDRLKMLAWLVQRDLLQVRIGLVRQGGGILHAKFGIATDPTGDAILFRGSGNESAQGLLRNFEQLEVSSSWDDPDALGHFRAQFQLLWTDAHPEVHTVDLPEALRQRLIRLAPKEAPVLEPADQVAIQRAAMRLQFLVEAPYLSAAACDATAPVDLWPHQRAVVQETAQAWPDGRLLCDEVGMGKTIEAILIMRRLLAGRGVKRLLILLPAGLLPQWQAELREKGGLLFPRLDGPNTLMWPDGRVEKVAGLAQALEQDTLLLSRETARAEHHRSVLMAARPWDLVALDESHAARRKGDEGDFNSATLLLALLRELQLRGRTRSLLLLSATPMQTQPWEPWDLLAVLGEGGRWLADFGAVRDYYGALAGLRSDAPDAGLIRRAALLLAADPRTLPPPTDPNRSTADSNALAQALRFARPSQRPQLARWLQQQSPLARRMHRNTRATLRHYHEQGLIPHPPPTRVVRDETYDFADPDERHAYDRVAVYIDRRYEALETEKPGKGFVMTIYRRRASSSPRALERSLQRRREGLQSVIQRKATADSLSAEEITARDLDDAPELGDRVSAALPDSPEAARLELAEVDAVLAEITSLHGRDSKRDRFFTELRRVTDDGRPVLVFTEYADTLDYLKDSLLDRYGKKLGCYSGDGGQRWEGSRWVAVAKAEIARALAAGELQAVVCTDAASEGLNLQAAGAVINYDLPWNPSRVEQRIGRVDRIGQTRSEVEVVNLFLKDSVDERVYKILRARCGLFEHFVGPMQPVLAQARRLLLGQAADEVAALEREAERVKGDLLAQETYLESLAPPSPPEVPAATRADLETALAELPPETGVRVKRAGTVCHLSGAGLPRLAFSARSDDLERDATVVPLTPESLRPIADLLGKLAPRGPLAMASAQEGAYRATACRWVGRVGPVDTVAQLAQLLDAWDGTAPDPATWLRDYKTAEQQARQQVQAMTDRTEERQAAANAAQRDAARCRLLQELGRHLVSATGSCADLNTLLHQQMGRLGPAAARLREAFALLGCKYPHWPDDLKDDLIRFAAGLTPNQAEARRSGRELEAAIHDPRWVGR